MEFVNELAHLGYLHRVPDPRDGRAKLIVPTDRGHQALNDAGICVAEIEQRWDTLVRHTKLDEGCYFLDNFLTKLATTHYE